MANRERKRRLLKQIAYVAEKAYRRGFQQGRHHALHPRPGIKAATDMQVYDWRFADHRETHAVGPPGTLFAGHRRGLLDRLKVELELEGCDEIRQLLYDVNDSDE